MFQDAPASAVEWQSCLDLGSDENGIKKREQKMFHGTWIEVNQAPLPCGFNSWNFENLPQSLRILLGAAEFAQRPTMALQQRQEGRRG